ncbi:MOSC domain-containing protein [Schlesneria sp. T3-172]|uniref:MOSC domain-containing protein n=1 Tax=Schlesneria sphaerica TaxID=3373610 RepID=UPI0037CC8178
MQAHVARVTIFPVKSCDGRSYDSATVLASGALQHDRQFALVDSSDRFMTAKRTPLMHRLRLQVDPLKRTFDVSQRDGSFPLSGELDQQGEQLSDWLTEYFSQDISIVENDTTGFPDDTDSNGPTIVSTATLNVVSEWFGGLPLDEVRNRFRASIEIDGVEPFWEDRLVLREGEVQPFLMGDVLFGGTNPCQRCVVPTRDSQSGTVTPPAFAVTFGKQREATLPAWATRERYDHFYRLATNTRLLNLGSGRIRVGDPVRLVDA